MNRTPESLNLACDGRNIAARRWSGTGTPLVLLPGAGGNALMFADLAEALPDREIVAIDPPGIGDSDDAKSPDLGRFADAIAEMVRESFGKPVVWVGHSRGGKVSAIVAGRNPELAAATILIDASPASALELDDDTLSQFSESIWDGKGGPWPTMADAIDSLRARPHYQQWTPNLETALRHNLTATSEGMVSTRCTLAGIYAEADTTLRVDYSTDIGAISCPTLNLVASESLWWQQISNDLVLPDHVERIEIEGQHFLYLDQPDRVASEISRFLRERGL